MDYVREYEEQYGIYEGGSEMDGEECNKLESAREEVVVEKEISLQEEMLLYYGSNMLAGYMRD